MHVRKRVVAFQSNRKRSARQTRTLKATFSLINCCAYLCALLFNAKQIKQKQIVKQKTAGSGILMSGLTTMPPIRSEFSIQVKREHAKSRSKIDQNERMHNAVNDLKLMVFELDFRRVASESRQNPFRPNY